jgi:hypothetical protein
VLSERAQILTSLVIPFFSVMLLLAVTAYIMVNAILVLTNHPSKAEDSVQVGYMYGFAAGNLVVDMVCFAFFYRTGNIRENLLIVFTIDTACTIVNIVTTAVCIAIA